MEGELVLGGVMLGSLLVAAAAIALIACGTGSRSGAKRGRL